MTTETPVSRELAAVREAGHRLTVEAESVAAHLRMKETTEADRIMLDRLEYARTAWRRAGLDLEHEMTAPAAGSPDGTVPVPADDLRAAGMVAERVQAVIAAQGEALSRQEARARRAEAELERARTELEHAKSALAGDHEGIRLWMLDCAELTGKFRKRAGEAEAKISRVREGISKFLSQYGSSQIPMFKVGQDLASSILADLDTCGQCDGGLVGIGRCNCGGGGPDSIPAHAPLCGAEPCPNGCWGRLHPPVEES